MFVIWPGAASPLLCRMLLVRPSAFSGRKRGRESAFTGRAFTHDTDGPGRLRAHLQVGAPHALHLIPSTPLPSCRPAETIAAGGRNFTFGYGSGRIQNGFRSIGRPTSPAFEAHALALRGLPPLTRPIQLSPGVRPKASGCCMRGRGGCQRGRFTNARAGCQLFPVNVNPQAAIWRARSFQL